MFKILDGRDNFYQWDLNRKIVLEDKTIAQVHFSNAFGHNAYVVLAQDGVAQVPNILLQEDADIYVYAYDGEATKHSATFGVVKRNKPDGYVYTETEVLNYTQLMDKLNKIDENMGEYVQDYLEKNPPEVDLTGYAKTEEIPNKVSQLENDEKFVDEDYLIEALDTLSDALEEQIPDVSEFITAIPEEYITESELAAKGYLTKHQDLSAYAKKSEIPSIAGLATETYVDNAVAAIPKTDLTNYATKAFVGEEIAKAQLESGDVDLSNYYTKSEVVELIPDTSGFALSSEIPDVSGFITNEGLAAKGYATSTQVENAINNALNNIGVAEEGAY